jgi:hypothetical protein
MNAPLNASSQDAVSRAPLQAQHVNHVMRLPGDHMALAVIGDSAGKIESSQSHTLTFACGLCHRASASNVALLRLQLQRQQCASFAGAPWGLAMAPGGKLQ